MYECTFTSNKSTVNNNEVVELTLDCYFEKISNFLVLLFKNSHWRYSIKKTVRKNLGIFTGKHTHTPYLINKVADF